MKPPTNSGFQCLPAISRAATTVEHAVANAAVGHITLAAVALFPAVHEYSFLHLGTVLPINSLIDENSVSLTKTMKRSPEFRVNCSLLLFCRYKDFCMHKALGCDSHQRGNLLPRHRR